MDNNTEIPVLIENEQLNANVGQSCSGNQLGDVSVCTEYCQNQPNTSNPEESQDLEELPQDTEYNSSQLSNETTITVGSHSHTTTVDSQESVLLKKPSGVNVDAECQTTDGVFLSGEEYDKLLKQASLCHDFKNNLNNIRSLLQNLEKPEMNPDGFQKLCRDCGAENLYFCIYDAICTGQMSHERKNLVKVRTMVIIYIMVYSQSQRCNSFQIALSRTLQQFGISERGLESLRNLGITAHPRTVKAQSKLMSSSHSDTVQSFIELAIENEHLLLFFIDDYHNIHTQHRPEAKTQTQAIHMTTLLLKVFPEVKAIPNNVDLHPKSPVTIPELKIFMARNMDNLSKTYAEIMPDWIVAKYFDPEAERQRLLVHDYQQTENQQMRCMDNTKHVDSLELPLKSCDNVLTAVKRILSSGLEIYLDKFVAPFVGDWPMQFFARQLVYSNSPCSAALKNAIPLIGPLHISLNARECILLIFHEIFADLYKFIFGKKAKLAKKPKLWRISLLLEIIYGGWTLIRDMVLSVFFKCKDIEYLTLVNLLDTYVPLVLTIYSIAFKCNKYEEFLVSLLKCWVMCVVFRRRHYNKALLVTLSIFHHWQENSLTMYETLRNYLVTLDEYPVENFHSVLRGRTKETDSADQIAFKAKEIDACKHTLQSFQSAFVPPRKFTFSRKKIDGLKAKAAEFLTNKFETLHDNPNMAAELPRKPRQPKYMTKWKLPNLFGEKVVTNRVLPLGFTSVENPPNPAR